MRTSSRRMAQVALTVSLALLLVSPAFALSSTQTLSYAGGDFNSCLPTVQSLAPSAPPSWNGVIFTAHQFDNASSVLDFDLVSSSAPSAFQATGGSSCLAYTQASGWFQWLRVQLSENGHVYVAFLQNSTSGSAIVLVNQNNLWLSNGTAVGTLTTNHESGINQGEQVFVSVSGGVLTIGAITKTGAIVNWLTGFGLPSHGLGGTYACGTSTCGGLTNTGTASGAFVSSAHVVPGAFSGNGYAQLEVNPSGFLSTQSFSSFTNIILEVVPLIVIVAVLGFVLRFFKDFNKK
jgi:hypothetical protein